MTTVRPRTIRFPMDDETWDALEARAEARGVSVAELAAHALEQLLERDGFTPAWALAPLDVRLRPSSGSRRRAR